ncbi:MAG TPA: hypothetical protein PK941_14075, partial [Paludibacter sp.]|nr:hypothetical protein [Paludibacter sp.]
MYHPLSVIVIVILYESTFYPERSDNPLLGGGEGGGIIKGTCHDPWQVTGTKNAGISACVFCTRSRGRTGTALRPLVFETSASTD